MRISTVQTATFRRSSRTEAPFTFDPQLVNVMLDGPAQQVAALLTGMNVRYTPGDNDQGNDHWLGQLQVQLEVVQDGPEAWTPGSARVPVRVRYLLRDWSHNVDDRFDGDIQFVVVGAEA